MCVLVLAPPPPSPLYGLLGFVLFVWLFWLLGCLLLLGCFYARDLSRDLSCIIMVVSSGQGNTAVVYTPYVGVGFSIEASGKG